MPTIKLSRSAVEKLIPTPGKQVRYFDSKLTGFGVIVSQASATYFVQCRVKGRKTPAGRHLEIYESIGRVGVVDYEKAVLRAKSVLDDASRGIAPDDRRQEQERHHASILAEQEAERKRDITLQEMFEEYVKARKKLKASTIELYREDIDRYLFDWKARPLRSIDGSMIVERHNKVGSRSRSRADGVMRVLRAVFNHALAMHDDIFTANPVKKLSAVNGWYKVPRRETYIKPGELQAWIPAALQLGYDTSSDFLLLMLFQGSRKTETATLQWKDVDLNAGVALFRETKTGVALEVPLSRFIIERLEKRKQFYFNGPESYVFPSYGQTGHIVDARTALSAIHAKSGVLATHHDLRRSFITYCEELEITLFSRKRLANHAIPLDVTEGYTFFNMEKLRDIIERVAEFILTNAGIPYRASGPAPLSAEQADKITGTAFWQGLNDEQRTAFAEMMAGKSEPRPNVIDLDAAKVRRRLAKTA